MSNAATRPKDDASRVEPGHETVLPGGNLIVFDGVCILCSGFARFMARHDSRAGFRFVDAHSDIGRALYRQHGLDPDLMETNIVLLEGRAYTKMASFTAAMRSLGWPWRMFTVLEALPTGLANWLYDRIARNRYRFGQRACALPSSELRQRLIVDTEDIEQAPTRDIRTENVSATTDGSSLPLFQRALGSDFDALPSAVQMLHTISGKHHFKGEARVTRGGSALGNLFCRLFGFPAAADCVPVSVTIEKRGNTEHWQRNFGGRIFRTELTNAGAPGSGLVRERFGLMSFDIPLKHQDDSLAFPVGQGRLLGLPLPKWLLPVSDTKEFQTSEDFCFDVQVSLPGVGLLVRYQGWLRPEAFEDA